LYEYVDNDLKKEIEKRTKNGLSFSEGEIWYILDSSIEALLCLKKKNVNHGDIRPYNILISNEG
jgi:serine/threonine protein kinase